MKLRTSHTASVGSISVPARYWNTIDCTREEYQCSLQQYPIEYVIIILRKESCWCFLVHPEAFSPPWSFLVSMMYNLCTRKPVKTVFWPKFWTFQFFFNGLMAQPTNRPPVWDYDPDTPLDMLKNKTTEMASWYDWHSYCSSVRNFDNQCFWDAYRLIPQVSVIMEVPLPRSKTGPCLKCYSSILLDWLQKYLFQSHSGGFWSYSSHSCRNRWGTIKYWSQSWRGYRRGTGWGAGWWGWGDWDSWSSLVYFTWVLMCHIASRNK